jgi:hypothetical protein
VLKYRFKWTIAGARLVRWLSMSENLFAFHWHFMPGKYRRVGRKMQALIALDGKTLPPRSVLNDRRCLSRHEAIE